MKDAREFGRIFGKVMQANPKADARLVNEILRVVADEVRAPDLEGVVAELLGVESVIEQTRRRLVRVTDTVGGIARGEGTPPGGAKVYLAYLIEQWDDETDGFMDGMEQAVEEAREYLIETGNAA